MKRHSEHLHQLQRGRIINRTTDFHQLITQNTVGQVMEDTVKRISEPHNPKQEEWDRGKTQRRAYYFAQHRKMMQKQEEEQKLAQLTNTVIQKPNFTCQYQTTV